MLVSRVASSSLNNPTRVGIRLIVPLSLLIEEPETIVEPDCLALSNAYLLHNITFTDISVFLLNFDHN